MTDITLNTKSCKSVIHCGEGAFELFASCISGKKFIVTDSNVYEIYSSLIAKAFGDSPVYVLAAGEKSKTFLNLQKILEAMAQVQIKRDCTLIALGGGVVGDISGLAASMYMRGIKIVQIPTTLLAQVDSSVGGKTAVDFKGIKNLVGAFYQPSEVIVDPVFLRTLPKREIACGLGEIIKYGALDKGIYQNLLKHADKLFDIKFLDGIVTKCIKHKAKVVCLDERDSTGVRKTLNLGHTTAHAIELCDGKKSHGECVLIGICYEAYIAERLGYGNAEYFKNLRGLINKVIKLKPYKNIDKAARFALMDKKNSGDGITIIAPKCEGESVEINLSFEQYAILLEDAI